jgi:hypothetical protein
MGGARDDDTKSLAGRGHVLCLAAALVLTAVNGEASLIIEMGRRGPPPGILRSRMDASQPLGA